MEIERFANRSATVRPVESKKSFAYLHLASCGGATLLDLAVSMGDEDCRLENLGEKRKCVSLGLLCCCAFAPIRVQSTRPR